MTPRQAVARLRALAELERQDLQLRAAAVRIGAWADGEAWERIMSQDGIET